MPDPLRHRVAPAARFSIAEHDTADTGPYASEDEAAEDLFDAAAGPARKR